MLRYECSGNVKGPRLVFLHGFMGRGADWKQIVVPLHDRFRCLTIDLPGHGESIALPDLASYNMVDTAAAIMEVVDEVGFDHFSVIGYSMGGRLALYLSIMFAMRVDSLVLESASPGLRTRDERAERRARDEHWADLLETEGLSVFLSAWYEQPLFESLRRNPERFEKRIEARRANVAEELARSLRGVGLGAQPPLWDDLAMHTLPTFLVVGELDAKFRAIAEAMAGACPAMRIALAADCGHNVHFEQPTTYTKLLQQFLSMS